MKMIENMTKEQYEATKENALLFMKAWHALKTRENIKKEEEEKIEIQIMAIESQLHDLLEQIIEYEANHMIKYQDEQNNLKK